MQGLQARIKPVSEKMLLSQYHGQEKEAPRGNRGDRPGRLDCSRTAARRLGNGSRVLGRQRSRHGSGR
uniref:Uncharacterized protein n=1 Tax=Rhizobium leguminosarum TaxID=384 RepID=A0A154I8D3_RHILE|nr:hypothetical protein A4A59_06195 [Rhizobium leguminosarum]